MKLLVISLMMSCNRRCYYCPVGKWLEPVDTPKAINLITKDALLKWLDEFIDPDEYSLEITGGEPGLHPEIDALLVALSERRYRGLVKTNGSLPITKTSGFKLVACYHQNAEFPKYYDEICIIENPHDDWRSKVEYCEANGIPYKTVVFDEWYKGDQELHGGLNKMQGILAMNSCGQPSACPKIPPQEGHDIFNMAPPMPRKNPCARCKVITDHEKFLPPDLTERIERDYKALRVAS